jgi:DNA-binding LytR/AlgR family response regulator
MNTLIIEDELPAAKRLSQLISRFRPQANILTSIDSVEGAIKWFGSNISPDLIFMDIQLADGLSFDIFNHVDIKAPVIFTTAYDQYTLKAFKVNSVDYLLKPIDPEELAAAFHKFDNFYTQNLQYDRSSIQQLIHAMSKPTYKERFIIKVGQQLTYVAVSDIQYFYSEDGLVYAKTISAKKHIIDYTLDQLENLLEPSQFFRLNRKVIAKIESIGKIAPYFNSRLKLDLKPKAGFDIIVSRDRVSDFKKWLDK